jgi:hypothetical protein
LDSQEIKVRVINGSALYLLNKNCFQIIDGLEASILWNAPFLPGLLETILIFPKCQDAPFQASYWTKIKSELNRKKVILQFRLNG